MHIVFLTNEYPKKGLNNGGIGSFIQFIGRELVKKGINISVVGINNSYSEQFDEDYGVKIYRTPKSKWKFGKFYQHTKNILKKIDAINQVCEINIVEGSELNFAFFPRKTNYKKVIRLHGGHHFFATELGEKPALWRGFQEKTSFKKADYFVAVSNYVGKQTQIHLNFFFPFTTIYNSVDLNIFKVSDKNKIIKHTLLFVGTVCEKKGVRQLVDAIPLIKKEIPDIKLKIVGRDWFFPNGNSYIDYLKTHIKNDCKDSIEIIGAVPHSEISNIIEKAEICVYPSHMEAMPIAWLEGLAMGKTVVASNIGPAKEMIINNETGVLVNPYSAYDISKKIIELFLDESKMVCLGKQARIDIKNRFKLESILNQNINFYKSILS
jgi:glycosyltransferase involved in cell wall biosynthesis